jgi:hypothetical protein
MNAATLLRINRDVITLLETSGVMTATGFDDTKLDSIIEEATFAAAVEAILKKHGVAVPGNVDRVIQLLPIIAGFIR